MECPTATASAAAAPMMERRRFACAIFALVVASSRSLRAESAARVYRLGILEAVPEAQNAQNIDALRKGLSELGYVEGRNLLIEYRSADGRPERFAPLAAELVRLRMDLIVTRGTPAAKAAKAATSTIPIVMATMGDPSAIVTSFAYPGGNVTGVTTFSTELSAKRVELLRELVPGLARVALLHNMSNPAAPPEWEETKAAARSLGLDAELLDVRNERELRRVLETMNARRIDAVVVGADGLMQLHRSVIVDRVGRSRLPASYPGREFVEAGGLISYAVNYPDLYRRFARFADRIFKGANPADLPVEQPTNFELAINLQTASALGIKVPQSLLLRADAVIR